MANMDIGMVGMAVMGSNLALNMADHGYQVACYNYTPDLTEKFVKEHPHENAHPFYDLKAFVASLKKPRKIMMMIMAGKPVDSMIEQLIPLLDKGDIIIDGGNSFFGDTMRRYDTCKAHGLNFFGTGISGGETGARRGPCIMPGGDKDAYDSVQPIFEAIAAKADGAPCCTYIGESGAGHFVKMVHNGIEYADMQLIAESYLLLKYAGGLPNNEIAKIFRTWNKGELKSYLVGITADVLAEHDDLGGGFLVDKIVDSAGQKGTGRWTSIEAMKEGVNTSLITAACNARVMSNQSMLRQKMQQALPAANLAHKSGQAFIDDVEASLYTGKIAAYAQGFALYRAASAHYSWQLDYSRIASIFRGGCIIQAAFLEKITEAYEKTPDLENLMEDAFFLQRIQQNLPALRRTVAFGITCGLPIPALANAASYIDTTRSPLLGANLIQGLRDDFGAHTYQRTDREGAFHHDWPQN
ncbi:NADP-dependent phosphogluconate dehydrogenase [uncultured Selenomonas sp.]|uniref:NADP-dependent phosphogluconate dehydrogenase n=1 Tax=uncultured Selenomonas sp. TaxID=159275 RepID=UPI0025DB9EFD|nr:NADP-dependent phosphogluconate dehydrogenase [uncultured Selenomonas sp.]